MHIRRYLFVVVVLFLLSFFSFFLFIFGIFVNEPLWNPNDSSLIRFRWLVDIYIIYICLCVCATTTTIAVTIWPCRKSKMNNNNGQELDRNRLNNNDGHDNKLYHTKYFFFSLLASPSVLQFSSFFASCFCFVSFFISLRPHGGEWK